MSAAGSAVAQTVEESGVALLRLEAPETRNALSPEVMEEVASRSEELDAEQSVRCLVIAGSDEVFASGADIRAMAERSFTEALDHPTASFWTRMATLSTPTIAAVSGWALGGGCELALLCDMCVASEKATFGQPEVTLGIIPGGGATQRIARVAGKQRAMELVLTGRRFDAREAADLGLVNRVTKPNAWLQEALDLAAVIASRPPLAVRLGKRAVLAADESPLAAGLAMERRLYELSMATEDRVEGMRAFLEKRAPEFRGR